MVEYCCADSFNQGPDLIKDFSEDALDFEKGEDLWQRYSEATSTNSALAELATSVDQLRQAKEVA